MIFSRNKNLCIVVRSKKNPCPDMAVPRASPHHVSGPRFHKNARHFNARLLCWPPNLTTVISTSTKDHKHVYILYMIYIYILYIWYIYIYYIYIWYIYIYYIYIWYIYIYDIWYIYIYMCNRCIPIFNMFGRSLKSQRWKIELDRNVAVQSEASTLPSFGTWKTTFLRKMGA